jgi:hypothetical protein
MEKNRFGQKEKYLSVVCNSLALHNGALTTQSMPFIRNSTKAVPVQLIYCGKERK